ncbi:hypothetical protein [Streptomyces camelliae]|uniref:Uncharacterized protein n=1 Tax=Streptomyces camelliae TaxID=3004093 RepID=A0ABY7PC41_9ACTN|nr:hypothetical protein [Streptomyces sp. HUAS 2-6]WBO68166.1 hypothetical protein O1G22_37780 [Streptomyces sp. HUAS 2-6]
MVFDAALAQHVSEEARRATARAPDKRPRPTLGRRPRPAPRTPVGGHGPPRGYGPAGRRTTRQAVADLPVAYGLPRGLGSPPDP